MFFAVKHIYLTLYIAYTYHVASTYSIPIYLAPLCCSRPPDARRSCSLSLLLAALVVRVAAWPCSLCSLSRAARCARCPCCSLCSLWPSYLRPDRFQPLAVRAARCARLPAPVCASADAWSTVDFLVRRPCAPGLLARVCARCARLRACARARCARPLCGAALPSICFRAHVFQPLAAVSVSRAYMVASPGLPAAFPPRRKLFRDRFQAVDICSAVVHMGERHGFVLLCGSIWGRGDSVAISWYAVGLKKSFARGLTCKTTCDILMVSQGQGPRGQTQARQAQPTTLTTTLWDGDRLYNSNPEPMTTITIRLPVWMKERVLQEAQKHRRSASDIVRNALEAQLVIEDKQGGE